MDKITHGKSTEIVLLIKFKSHISGNHNLVVYNTTIESDLQSLFFEYYIVAPHKGHERMCDEAEDEVDAVSPLLQKGLAVKAAESLAVIKEDLSEWLSNLLKININADNFMTVLDTGVVLCRLVGAIQEHTESLKNEGKLEQSKLEQPVPMTAIKYKDLADHGSFFARDNAANFIKWCRAYKIGEAILFESDDLVMHKDEKLVVLTLLEVARRIAKLGMQSTQLAMMEIAIDNNEDIKEPATPPPKVPDVKKKKLPPNLVDSVSCCQSIISLSSSFVGDQDYQGVSVQSTDIC